MSPIFRISKLLCFLAALTLSQLTLASPIDPSDISWDSSSGVQSVNSGSYSDLFINNGFGLGIFGNSATPSVTWNFSSGFDLDSFSYRSQFGSNHQGAVSGFQLNFFDEVSGGGSLLGTLNGVQNSPGSVLTWNLSSLNLVSVESFEFVMLTREPITSSAVPGNHYEMGFMAFEGTETPSTVPEPAQMILLASGLLLLGLRKRPFPADRNPLIAESR